MRHLFLQIHITGKCNLRCKHCYIDEHSVDMSYKDFKMALKQFDDFIRIQKKQTGKAVTAHIHLTGGEPFLHPEIGKILMLLIRNRHRYRFGLMTNGTLLTPKYLLPLKLLRPKAVQVSIDGTEDTHDAVRGKGNYRKVLKALDMLYRWNFPSRVSFTANQQNFREFPQVAEICRQHHARTLWSDRYIPFEHVADIRPLDLADMEEYVRILRSEKNKKENALCGLSVQNYRALQFIGSDNNPYCCQAGENMITIDEYGNIFPCRRLPINCGNIHTESIRHVYEHNSTFINLRKHPLAGKCLLCKHRTACKGGERCFTFAITERFDYPDPCCWIKETD